MYVSLLDIDFYLCTLLTDYSFREIHKLLLDVQGQKCYTVFSVAVQKPKTVASSWENVAKFTNIIILDNQIFFRFNMLTDLFIHNMHP